MPLPNVFFSAQQVRTGEYQAAQDKGLPMFTLMERAGQAVFTLALAQYPGANHWLICCGGGNNGGDGYIVAGLARSMGIDVTLWQIGEPAKLKGDAKIAYEHWVELGGEVSQPEEYIPEEADLIIDGILGTGLSGTVRQNIVFLIEQINQCDLPVISIDVPSGLCANKGAVLGDCVIANHTVTFIGVKQGLVTGQARDYVGHLHFAGLGVNDAFNFHQTPTLYAIEDDLRKQWLPRRKRTAHKGSHGKALLVGGNEGMGGAMILASRACCKCGTGLTAAMLHGNNVPALLATAPEVMSADWAASDLLKQRMRWCDVVAIGPGLGREGVAQYLYDQIADLDMPKVMDADALYFLARDEQYDDKRIMTPHSGEAARMLEMSVADVEADRFKAVKDLQRRYGGVVVLKGAGTLVYDGLQTYVCLDGNPGMATGGMGDVLTGVITAMMAQGLSLSMSARLGVLIHSKAADQNAQLKGERGLLASDLMPHLRELVN